MQEIFRALLVVFVIALGVFWFAKTALTETAIAPQDFDRRRNLWLWLTLALFLSHNFWVFMAISAGLLLVGARQEKNLVALLFSLVLAVPLMDAQLPALGLVNYLFELNFMRLFSLLVLFPAFLLLRRQPGTAALGSNYAERFVLGYLLLLFALQLPPGNITSALRFGFLLFVDIFLPYYIASRSLKTLQDFRDALASLVLVAAVMGVIGLFEYLKGWLLYSNIAGALDASWSLGQYLSRGTSLRALANTGQPLVLGFVLAVALCAYLFVRESISSPKMRTLGLLGLLLVLVAPLSRGPWVGALSGYLVFWLLGPQGLRTVSKKGAMGLGLLLLAMLSPFGAALIDHLPFVGTVDSQNVVFRADLLSASLKVIARNPLLGTLDYYSAPELEALRWGGDNGIIDIVNSYIAIALGSGLIGLGLFVGFVLCVVYGVFGAMRGAASLDPEIPLLGRALLAAMACTVITIYTVSSLSFIPIVYWVIFGMGVSYQALVQLHTKVKPIAANPLGQLSLGRPAPRRRAAPAARERSIDPRREIALFPDATRKMPLFDEATREMPLDYEAAPPLRE